MNKPTFLVIKKADGLVEYINTNHILKAIYTKDQDCQGLSIKFVTGAIMTIVLKDSETESILRQWLDYLEGSNNDH